MKVEATSTTETSGTFDCHTAQKLIGRAGIHHVRKLKSQ
jgi:hypothetical protein